MRMVTKFVCSFMFILSLSLFLLGCGGPRFSIITATNMGLNINSGDGNTRPPQVAVAYKRTELALVPTGRNHAIKDPDIKKNKDAYSSLAGYHFYTEWFGPTTLSQFISTGHASRDIQTDVFRNAVSPD